MVHEYFKMMRVQTRASILILRITLEAISLDPPFLEPSIQDIKRSKVITKTIKLEISQALTKIHQPQMSFKNKSSNIKRQIKLN